MTVKKDKVALGFKYSICVSGAASGRTVEASSGLAERIGAAIAHSGHVTITGATVGLPFYAAKGAKEAGGMSIGFSPAGSIREHLRKYRLPAQYFDYINYTGLTYVGRDIYLVQSSDAVITVGGRFGSLHEFTTALEAGKPCGVLTNSGGTADMIKSLMDTLEPPHRDIVIFDDNPERLIKRILEVLDDRYDDVTKQFMREQFWFLEHGSKHGKLVGGIDGRTGDHKG